MKNKKTQLTKVKQKLNLQYKRKYFASRAAVPKKFCWNLKKLYAGENLWEKEYKITSKMIEPLEKYRGRLKKSSVILKYFNESSEVLRKIEKLYVYASHLNSTDLADQKSQILNQKARNLYIAFSTATSFQGPELVKLPESTLKTMIKNKKFYQFQRELKIILKKRKHVLSSKEESLLSLYGKLTNGPEDIFSTLDNVDITFDDVKDEKGNIKTLTGGNYQGFMENLNRNVRRRAYENFYNSYKSHINTFAQILNLAIQQHYFLSSARKYKNCIESSLSINMIDSKVYTTLIKEAHSILPILHRYFKIRSKKLGLKKLSMYDLRVNTVKSEPLHFSWEEAVNLCLEAVSPLGKEYVETLKEGLYGGWVDIYENKGKRGGAFSGGCYDSYPYILMNFTGTLNDVYTLIHEAGHSMHSWYARKNQPYSLSDYSLFTAEIASTVNERLLTKHLLKKFSGQKRKIILAYEIDAIRATFFRQTMFAEFELNIHNAVERGIPLTTDYLNTQYANLNDLYHGPNVQQDDLICMEWARIPHFYYNFYVYQYATGIAAAFYFSDRILENDKTNSKNGMNVETVKYIEFLKQGGNDFPLKQLKKLGLDFTSAEIYRAIAENLQKCLNQL